MGDHEDTIDDERFYWRVCVIGIRVLDDGMSHRWTCLAEAHAVWVDVLLTYMN